MENAETIRFSDLEGNCFLILQDASAQMETNLENEQMPLDDQVSATGRLVSFLHTLRRFTRQAEDENSNGGCPSSTGRKLRRNGRLIMARRPLTRTFDLISLSNFIILSTGSNFNFFYHASFQDLI